MKNKIIISVITDLATDQRVHRTAIAFYETGYEVVLVGRKLKQSFDLDERPYQTKRLSLWFEKGPLFYAVFNLRLFFFLLFNKASVLYSNDLDTLLPNFLVAKLKNRKLVYDSHEYFTGVPELQQRPLVKSVWKSIEKFIFPKLEHIITVNNSIAELYKKEYGKEIIVVRNVPLKNRFERLKNKEEFRRKNGLPTDKKILILQGTGINIHRGAEEAVMAMKYLDDFLLLIIGAGDVCDDLKKIIEQNNLSDRVIMKNKLPYNELMQFTQAADLGLTLDKGTNINYRFSLPNKLFDYLHAGIPVLASDVVEVKKIVEHYNVGRVLANVLPELIAKEVKNIFYDADLFQTVKANTQTAASELNWDIEKEKMISLISLLNKKN